jgi:putative ABC transport system permease protein
MSRFLLDLRHGARVLVNNLSASVVAIVTLALAIGAATAIFSVVYGVLLQPLPYPAPARLMDIFEVSHRGTYIRLADPNFDDFHDRNHTFGTMAKYFDWVTSVSGTAEPTRAKVTRVTKDFMNVLGVQPSLGRGIAAADARTGAAPVAIVSHRYWVQSLGSTATLSNFQLRIEDREYTVVGVMPTGFQFPAKSDVWVPAELDAEDLNRTDHQFRGIGRLRDGVSAAQAAADLSAIAKDIIRSSPEQGDYLLADATVLPLQTSLTRRVSSTLYVLFGAVFLLLFIACANVTNLLLALAAARHRELAIRHALGAARRRLVGQFVTESLMLLAIAGLGGLLIAWIGTNALLSLAPGDFPRLENVSMNRAVLAFGFGLSALVAIALGLFTALRSTRHDPREALVDGARWQTTGVSRHRVGRIIVAAQMAMSVVLIIGATLLGRSLLRVLSVDPGFRTDGIIAMDLAMPAADDPQAKARLAPVLVDVLDRLRAIPGIDDVAAANVVPMDGGLPDGSFAILTANEVPKTVEDLKPLFRDRNRIGPADYCAVSSAYFQALAIPLVRGRLFDGRDREDTAHVALISESLARTRWPNADPIGATVEFGNMDGYLQPLTIVGIVGDTREYGLERPARPTMYVDLLQRPASSVTVVMRTQADPRNITNAARRILREVAPDVPPRFRTFAEIYSASLGARRFNLTLVAVFAITALLLAVAGIYGVMSYSVTQRRKEIGVRIALGATPGQVFRIILGQGLATTATGLAIGVVAALGLTRTIESLLFGVTPTDPITFLAVIVLLGLVATLACWLPAQRATAADPMDALRQE